MELITIGNIFFGGMAIGIAICEFESGRNKSALFYLCLGVANFVLGVL